ncbi:MAG: FixH family protein [Planctomycetota bacterium]
MTATKAVRPSEITGEADSKRVAEKRAKRFWIALVLFLFVVQGTIMGTVIKLAIGDPSAAIVPDYHNAAIHWDETVKMRSAAERLGWKVAFEPSDVVDTQGMRALEVNIVDKAGQPVDGLMVTGSLYHHARANDVCRIQFAGGGDGRYIDRVPASRAGIWQLELLIDGAEERIASSITFELEAS